MHASWNAHPAVIRLAVNASHAAARLREPAMRVVDAVQMMPAGQQIETVFAAAVILARGAGLDPHELVVRARRQVPDIEFGESAASAISDYAKGELR